MKVYSTSILAFIFIILLSSDTRAADRNSLIMRIIQKTQQRYAPDKRTAVFTISFKQTKSGIVLFGEVDSIAVKNAVIEQLRTALKEEIADSIQLLPSPALGKNRYGIITKDVGDVRREPREQAELVSQGLMGTVMTLIKKANGFYFVRMPDRYLGWINATSLFITDQSGLDAWNTSPRIIITKMNGIVYKEPDSSSRQICSIVTGCVLKIVDRKNKWMTVELPGGQSGFISDSLAQNLQEWTGSRKLTGEDLEKTARTLLGVPYLWGGTSVKGMDCSGFVKIVYRLNGLELDRDADQQACQGTNIDPGRNFENLQKGDLLFFAKKEKGPSSRRMTHVGLYLGNRIYIHSSGFVQLSSFEPASQYFNESLLKRFKRAQRIIRK
jgi:gamma-D-glutamyl-L-lysine dipeptidyl-peptidase